MSNPSLPPFVSAILPDQQSKRGWKVILQKRTADGAVVEEEITDAAGVRLVQPKMGLELLYGQTLGGYDAWAFHEPGGGGAVIVPYAIINDRVVVGVVTQKRPLQNREKPILNLPRGMANPGERPFLTASREAGEELGVEADMLTLEPLPGEHVNPNSAFFDTAGPDEGVKFFSLKVPMRMLQKAVTVSAVPLTEAEQPYEFQKEHVRQDPASKNARAAEQILGSRFIPANEALALADGFTVIGVARLLVHLSRADTARL